MAQGGTARDLVARASVAIAAPPARVWEGLTNPEIIKKYMFGADVACDWREGSPLVIRGEWDGKPFEDKGMVVRVVEGRLLEYTHFSPASGVEDLPENYHTITVDLAEDGDRTVVSLAQDNNATEDERDRSASMWTTMLGTLRDVLES
ncbi:MAG: SRPBCC family protein [Actinomycetota bacterium]